MSDPRSEYEHQGWKVFVSTRGDSVVLEATTDTVPLHRMTFLITPDEAEEIASMLMGAVLGLEADHSGSSRGPDE